jgi:hypothetical protein
MTDDNKNQNLLLGCAALVGVLAVCGGMYYINQDSCENENENEYDSDDSEYEYKKQKYNRRSHIPEYYCGSDSSRNSTPMPEKYVPPINYSSENYHGNDKVHSSSQDTNVVPPVPSNPSESYELPASEHYASPLNFSAMAGGYSQENYAGVSDYQQLGGYSEGSQNIPVFDEKSGQIGLPVPDMTDISAGENNKYVYDRTIGTIGFTSTKINGRRRGVADFIRGDLPIIPDNNSSFNVSADPNVLQVGFMDAGEYASRFQQAKNQSGGGGQRAIDPNAKRSNPYDTPATLNNIAQQNVALKFAADNAKAAAAGVQRAAPTAAVRRAELEKQQTALAKEVLGPNATAQQLAGIGGYDPSKELSINDLKNFYAEKQAAYQMRNGL